MIKRLNILYISIGDDNYEEINVRDVQSNKYTDITAVNKRIGEYESDGWEFIFGDNEYAGQGDNYFTITLRRKK